MELKVTEYNQAETKYGKISKIGSSKKDGTVCFTGISREWRETLVIGGQACIGFEIKGKGVLYYEMQNETKEINFSKLSLDLANTGYVLCVENKNTYGTIKLSENGHMAIWHAEPWQDI